MTEIENGLNEYSEPELILLYKALKPLWEGVNAEIVKRIMEKTSKKEQKKEK